MPIVTSIVDATIVSIMNPAIASLPDPHSAIQEVWGNQDEAKGDGDPYSQNFTPIGNDNTAA